MLGSVKKTFTKPGKAKLRLRLNGAGRRAFTSGKLASIKLTVTGKLSAFAPGATVVHLDIDAAEISKIRHADIPVVGPLKPVLAEMARILADARRPGATEPWLRQIAEWRDTYPLRYRNDGDRHGRRHR